MVKEMGIISFEKKEACRNSDVEKAQLFGEQLMCAPSVTSLCVESLPSELILCFYCLFSVLLIQDSQDKGPCLIVQYFI